MTARELLSTLSQVLYLALFVVALVRLVRRPSLAAFDTFLFFAVIAVILLAGDVAGLLGFAGHPALATLTWVGIASLPLILLRLADDFRPQPSWVMIGASILFALVAALGVVAPQPWPVPLVLVPVAWVVLLGAYASWAFIAESRLTSGFTRLRVQAVALGSLLLALVLLLAGVSALVPAARPVVSVANQVASMALVLSYFVGFAPPGMLRRAWQEPILRRFMAETPRLVRDASLDDVLERIRDRATELTGASGATIGLWDSARETLVFREQSGEVRYQRPGEWIGGRAFEAQRTLFSTAAEKDAPEHASEYRAAAIHAVVAAPITADEQRLGVLVVYAARPFVFTDDAVSMTNLVAELAATVIRSHELAREAAEVRALAEVTRLKQDFLSVVAHDVRTPLTTILINAELLERSLASDAANARRVASLHAEAERLKRLVEEYLRVVQTEEGERELRLEPLDLRDLAAQALDAISAGRERVRLVAPDAVPGMYDGARVFQLVQNLVGNAIKYSEPEEPIEMRVWSEGSLAHLSVTDRGMGIPEDDLPRVFERFHRGANADDRRHAGLGLGLYICRLVAREHGGDVTATSRLGEGTTFTAILARGEWPGAVVERNQGPASAEPSLEPAAESQ